MPTLFDSLQLGAIAAPNRILMAPLTRNRATPGDNAVRDWHERYYAQRASAGLIITEATQISPEGKGYAWTPGIHSPVQVAAWKRVVEAVHAAGGRIALQLWHVGRISHVDLQPDGQAPVAPSAIHAEAQTFLESGQFAPVSAPRALETAEVARVVEDFGRAAANARVAGFDAVEVHAANGYLIDQFLRDGSNQRGDGYGGTLANRIRFLAEVLDAVAGAMGPERTGVRLSPWSRFGDMADSDPMATFGAAIAAIDARGLAWLHLVEGETGGARAPDDQIAALRAGFRGAYVANNNYTPELAAARVAAGLADAVAFGRPFIANPDLPARIAQGGPYNAPDPSTFYGGDERGLTDYPALAQAA